MICTEARCHQWWYSIATKEGDLSLMEWQLSRQRVSHQPTMDPDMCTMGWPFHHCTGQQVQCAVTMMRSI